MSDTLSLIVKEGDLLTAKLWDQLARTARSVRILFGDGIRGRRTPDGTLLSCSLWSPWPHPFTVSLSGTTAKTSKGTVDSIEPTIKGVPISGTTTAPQPSLDLSSPKFNADGLGWIAIEVTVGAVGYKTVSAELVQVASLAATSALKARQPIALLVRKSGGGFTLFQIAYFNYQHVAYLGNGVPRHFFYPA